VKLRRAVQQSKEGGHNEESLVPVEFSDPVSK
jgi:hypothetical protein